MNPRVFEEIKETPMIEIIQSVEQHIDDKNERKEEIEFLLDVLNIPYETQEYSTGKNLFASLGKPPFIGIGSHYDVVPKTPGANDNGSAIAVTIDILRRAQKEPLENIGIRGFFFDEEEVGLKGSRAYVKEKGIEDLIGLYNMELVGSGNKVALWSVNDIQNTPLLKKLESKAREQKIEVYRIPMIVTNAADHLSFKKGGLEDSFTLTTITQEDLDVAPQYYAALQSRNPQEEGWKVLTKAPVFRHYHQPTDKSENLSQQTLQMVSDLLWNSIKEIDKAYHKRGG